PAILTALLGYLLFIFSLMVDLGRPWHIWRALYSWNHNSPMFEVAWCVMFYTFVLALEFTPVILERLHLDRLTHWWYRLSPLAVVAAITLFAYAMTASPVWAAVTFAVLATWEVAMRTGVMPRDKQMPILLIMAGIMLSTLHQSSLGTLFLIVDKLSALWYTPLLPLLFFASAIMVAPAMVIIESTLSARVLHRRPEHDALAELAEGMPLVIGIYLFLRLADLVARGAVLDTVIPSLQSVWWWMEIGLLVAALVSFAIPDICWRPAARLSAATATVLALVVHRFGVALVGIRVPEYSAYVPAWSEVMISVGIVAAGLLAFRFAIEFLPVYAGAGEEIEEPAEAPEVVIGPQGEIVRGLRPQSILRN
ncbi:MAG: polysulfide reductase NrfD, partial [Gemmatimonadales bacterium]|nr:polysulfide reductase NrfD [Gemmatimonadales bacterium]